MQIKFPIDEHKDYTLPENRFDLAVSWAEAMYQIGELDQQLRLMNRAIPKENIESKLWLAFLWGCCYNFTGPFVIMSEFPEPPESMKHFTDWYNENFERIRFDTDCRYRKSKMIACVQSYIDWLDGSTQADKILPKLNMNGSYYALEEASNSWKYYGRLSCWNYLEAVALVTEHPTFDCPDFLLTDVTGSESNRNGVAFMINREDLVTKHGKSKQTGKRISQEDLEMLSHEGERIFQEVKALLPDYNVKRFNFETVMCWNKKRFRARNSRYLGWDDERTIDEINFVKEHWPELVVEPIFEARKHFLPDFMVEQRRGVNKEKMGVFFNTGKPQDLIHYQRGEAWIINSPVFEQSNTTVLW